MRSSLTGLMRRNSTALYKSFLRSKMVIDRRNVLPGLVGVWRNADAKPCWPNKAQRHPRFDHKSSVDSSVIMKQTIKTTVLILFVNRSVIFWEGSRYCSGGACPDLLAVSLSNLPKGPTPARSSNPGPASPVRQLRAGAAGYDAAVS